ncbi:DUF2970 domain-containing protein [Pseudoalteromonas tunicata]|uniref:DUF2970 domain-containing protein n=1 Tax=Pseudoalteromonas tunicata TaxID=314281 RepID=UPI0003239D0D|nr:DUF2970 domain-containing protein [Pseudoalteromonas tunicata]
MNLSKIAQSQKLNIYLSNSLNRFIAILQSVFAGFLGVQSEQKRKQDFQELSPLPIIITALIALILFIGLIYGFVQLVVP